MFLILIQDLSLFIRTHQIILAIVTVVNNEKRLQTPSPRNYH